MTEMPRYTKSIPESPLFSEVETEFGKVRPGDAKHSRGLLFARVGNHLEHGKCGKTTDFRKIRTKILETARRPRRKSWLGLGAQMTLTILTAWENFFDK